jgi:hypothetical protein
MKNLPKIIAFSLHLVYIGSSPGLTRLSKTSGTLKKASDFIVLSSRIKTNDDKVHRIVGFFLTLNHPQKLCVNVSSTFQYRNKIGFLCVI